MKRIGILLSSLLVLMTMTNCMSSVPAKPEMLVVVNSKISELIQPEINQYQTDLEKEGYAVQIISYSCETPNQLREAIKKHNPDGVFLIGDFPVAWFEIYPYTTEIETGTYEFPYHIYFPTDLYYTDLDGIWVDNDGNGYFDQHTGNREPEVFLGRLKTSNMDLLGNEVTIIKDYLNKNHRYRIGLMETKNRALVYGWHPSGHEGISPEKLDWIYLQVDIVEYQWASDERIEYQDVGRNKKDFLRRIQNGYQFIKLGGIGHSGSYEVTMGDESLTGSDLIAANPQSQFYIIGSCENARYTCSNFITGYFAYTGEGLIAIGTSSAGGGIGKAPAFFETLQLGGNFGEAVKAFFTLMISADHPEWYANSQRATHCYSTTLIGDPTLKIKSALVPQAPPKDSLDIKQIVEEILKEERMPEDFLPKPVYPNNEETRQ